MKMLKFYCKKANHGIRKILVVPSLLVLIFSSCEEFVTVPEPGTGIISKNVFDDDVTALAAVSAIYGQMSNAENFTHQLSFIEGVYTDELVSFVPVSVSDYINTFYLNAVMSNNSFASSTWGNCYNSIFSANLIIEGLSRPNGVSIDVKEQLMGEALFIRAFCHFYLVNLFGDVPLIKTSDYKINSRVSRTPVAQVYESIIEDLHEAKDLLSDMYPSADRVRVNKGAATALLARSYLYAQKFVNAEIQATEIIDKSLQYKLQTNLNEVFLKTSEEAIWQLYTHGDKYTYEGYKFIVVAAPPAYVTLKKELYDEFESGDLRKTNWINSIVSESGFSSWYYPFKYKENHLNATDTECSMVLRLAEQYLIRAEARAQLNKLVGPSGAVADINVIRNRAGLTNTTATSRDELLTAILQERQFELFAELGHRFFDLRRMEKLDVVMESVKSNWDSHNALLPIPQSEILVNSNLKPQNPGY